MRIKRTYFNNLRVTNKELEIIRKLVGGLSKNLAISNFNMSEDEYRTSVDMYYVLDNFTSNRGI